MIQHFVSFCDYPSVTSCIYCQAGVNGVCCVMFVFVESQSWTNYNVWLPKPRTSGPAFVTTLLKLVRPPVRQSEDLILYPLNASQAQYWVTDLCSVFISAMMKTTAFYIALRLMKKNLVWNIALYTILCLWNLLNFLCLQGECNVGLAGFSSFILWKFVVAVFIFCKFSKHLRLVINVRQK
jgi:hypothetical protein